MIHIGFRCLIYHSIAAIWRSALRIIGSYSAAEELTLRNPHVFIFSVDAEVENYIFLVDQSLKSEFAILNPSISLCRCPISLETRTQINPFAEILNLIDIEITVKTTAGEQKSGIGFGFIGFNCLFYSHCFKQ